MTDAQGKKEFTIEVFKSWDEFGYRYLPLKRTGRVKTVTVGGRKEHYVEHKSKWWTPARWVNKDDITTYTEIITYT